MAESITQSIRGYELLSLFGHHGIAPGVAFSPDGTWLTSVGIDDVIRGYWLDNDLLKEITREKHTRSPTEEESQKYLRGDDCRDDS